MKPNRKEWLLWLLALTASSMLLVVANASKAQPLPRPEGASGPQAIPFTDAFNDLSEKDHSISCEISAEGHKQEVGSVGFTARQYFAWLNPRMYKKALDELQENQKKVQVQGCLLGLSPPTPTNWWVPSLDCSRPDPNFREEAQQTIDQWRRELDQEKKILLEDFYKSRSLALNSNGTLDIDYAAVIKRAKPLLKDCAQKLVKEGGDQLDANFFASFLQQLKYQKLESPKGDVHTRDFLVPTQVLVEKRGDCDSKAAAFCALWRNYSPDVILLVSNRHAIVGYKAPPNTLLQSYPVGLNRYVPCDVSGQWAPFPKCGDFPRDTYRPIFTDG